MRVPLPDVSVVLARHATLGVIAPAGFDTVGDGVPSPALEARVLEDVERAGA